MNLVRYLQLRREVEFLCDAALDTAAELDRSSPDSEDAPYLAQAVVHLALKVSYLVWRFGRRMTDRYGAVEADRLRSLLEVDDSSPLSPGQISPLVGLITIPDDELIASFHFGSLSVQAGGALRPLRPMIAALEQLRAKLAASSVAETTLGTVV